MTRPLNKEQLAKILNEHSLWIDDSSKGKRADLTNYDLSGINFSNMNLQHANFEGSTLTHANFTKAILTNANFKSCDIGEANFHRAELDGTGIIQFKLNKHYAYYVNGMVRMDCIYKPLDWWLKNGPKVGDGHGYNPKEIKAYMAFIEICKDFQKP